MRVQPGAGRLIRLSMDTVLRQLVQDALLEGTIAPAGVNCLALARTAVNCHNDHYLGK
jgi:hypothetical protein